MSRKVRKHLPMYGAFTRMLSKSQKDDVKNRKEKIKRIIYKMQTTKIRIEQNYQL